MRIGITRYPELVLMRDDACDTRGSSYILGAKKNTVLSRDATSTWEVTSHVNRIPEAKTDYKKSESHHNTFSVSAFPFWMNTDGVIISRTIALDSIHRIHFQAIITLTWNTCTTLHYSDQIEYNIMTQRGLKPYTTAVQCRSSQELPPSPPLALSTWQILPALQSKRVKKSLY